MTLKMTRRAALLTVGAAGLVLPGCERIDRKSSAWNVLRVAEDWNYWAQRSLMVGQPLAREYGREDISRVFKINGSRMPESEAYQRHLSQGFADWRLAVGGLVEKPLSLSLAQLHGMPKRTQITRHDCVEGWSCIGQWTGVPLAHVLGNAELAPGARYVVFHCADNLSGARYYESIDLVDALHPQTILAYAMNGETLPVGHGAPLRLRVERQLGYKMAKFIMSIEVVSDFANIYGGQGGYWEDRGYAWYAGI